MTDEQSQAQPINAHAALAAIESGQMGLRVDALQSTMADLAMEAGTWRGKYLHARDIAGQLADQVDALTARVAELTPEPEPTAEPAAGGDASAVA